MTSGLLRLLGMALELDLPRFSPAKTIKKMAAGPAGKPAAISLRLPSGCRRSDRHGVEIVGRGAVAMPEPMKKLGCGGWL